MSTQTVGWMRSSLPVLVLATISSGCTILPGGATTQETQELGRIGPADPTMNHAPIVDEHGNLIDAKPAPHVPPAELSKVSLPPYRLAPPDVLLVDAIRLVPKSPYRIQTQDFLSIIALGAPPENPIASQFQVEPSGLVNLGPGYGSVKIVGLTLDEATQRIATHLRRLLERPQVSVSLLQVSGVQQIAGEHLIGFDGTVTLGTYGSVYLTGLTLEEARKKIEDHLSQYLDAPKVSVDVFSYNSKNYYVIFSGGGTGDSVTRLPVTGNETVLDAISLLSGFDPRSTTRMWIARPAPRNVGCAQVLPIDWQAITREGDPSTNYQLLPGDRLFVAHDRLIALDTFMGKVIQPFERVFGFTLLGSQTIQNLQRFPEGQLFR